MSRCREIVGLATAVAITAVLAAACFCGDSCDQPDRLHTASYRLESTSPKRFTRESRFTPKGGLVFDEPNGIVTVTRFDAAGRTTTERWRVVGRGAQREPKVMFELTEPGL